MREPRSYVSSPCARAAAPAISAASLPSVTRTRAFSPSPPPSRTSWPRGAPCHSALGSIARAPAMPFHFTPAALERDGAVRIDRSRGRRNGDVDGERAERSLGAHVRMPVAAESQQARELRHLRAFGIAAEMERLEHGRAVRVDELGGYIRRRYHRQRHPHREAVQIDRALFADAARACVEAHGSVDRFHRDVLGRVVLHLDVGARAPDRRAPSACRRFRRSRPNA